MKVLEVRRLSGQWHRGREVMGHGGRRAVSFGLEAGEWAALVGRNGLGKSTILHAIAGSVPYVSGRVNVDGVVLRPRDVKARFSAGVQFVTQHSQLRVRGGQSLQVDDSLDLALAFRQGLENEVALCESLLPLLREQGWFSGVKVGPRMFDLLTAIVSVPRLLLLDEVIPLWGAEGGSSTRYAEIRKLLPGTSVVVVDHDIERVLEAADTCVWLQEDDRPRHFRADDKVWRDKLLEAQGSDAVVEESATLDDDWSDVLRLDRDPRSQAQLAVQARLTAGRERTEACEGLFRDFGFLDTGNPAETLSGGQRLVLLWILLEVGGLGSFPQGMMEHIDRENREMIEVWKRRGFGNE